MNGKQLYELIADSELEYAVRDRLKLLGEEDIEGKKIIKALDGKTKKWVFEQWIAWNQYGFEIQELGEVLESLNIMTKELWENSLDI